MSRAACIERVAFGADEYLNSNAGRRSPRTISRSTSAPPCVAQKWHSAASARWSWTTCSSANLPRRAQPGVPPQRRRVGQVQQRVPLCARAVEVLRGRRSGFAESRTRPRTRNWCSGASAAGDRRRDPLEARQRSGHRGRAPRVPVVVPGLGVGADGPPAGGHGGGAGARREGPDRGGLRALGPVRAAAVAADGRLGNLPHRGAGAGRLRAGDPMPRESAPRFHERGPSGRRGTATASRRTQFTSGVAGLRPADGRPGD